MRSLAKAKHYERLIRFVEINVLFSANFGYKVVTFCALFRHLQRDTSKISANYYVRITYQYQDFGLHLKQQQVLC